MEGGHEGTEGSLSCWQPGSCARVLADSAGRAGWCHTRCSPPPEQSFSWNISLCAFLTLSLLGKLFLSLIPGAFLLILQDPARRPPPPCSIPWLLWPAGMTPASGTPRWGAGCAVRHPLGACFGGRGGWRRSETCFCHLLPGYPPRFSHLYEGRKYCKEFWVAINRINQMTCVMPVTEPGTA